MESLITIKLFGASYSFKTASSDSQTANEIADILVAEVNKIQEQMPGQAPEMTKFTILMLAALNMASEIHGLKQTQTHFVRALNEKSSRLAKLIDEGIGPLEEAPTFL